MNCFSYIIKELGHNVTLGVLESEKNNWSQTGKTLIIYGVPIPQDIIITNDYKEVILNNKIIVKAIPSKFFVQTWSNFSLLT